MQTWSDQQHEWLVAETRRLGLRSVSDLVRRIVDQHRDQQHRLALIDASQEAMGMRPAAEAPKG